MWRWWVSVGFVGVVLWAGSVWAGSGILYRRVSQNTWRSCPGVLVEEFFESVDATEQVQKLTWICFQDREYAHWVLQAGQVCLAEKGWRCPGNVHIRTRYPRRTNWRPNRPLVHDYRLRQALVGESCQDKDGVWRCQQVYRLPQLAFSTTANHSWIFGLDDWSQIVPQGYLDYYYGSSPIKGSP